MLGCTEEPVFLPVGRRRARRRKGLLPGPQSVWLGLINFVEELLPVLLPGRGALRIQGDVYCRERATFRLGECAESATLCQWWGDEDEGVTLSLTV